MMLRAQEALLSQEALPRPGRSPRRADRLFSLTQFASPAPPSPLYLLSGSGWGCNKASLLLTIFSHFQENLILPTP